jgi:hypothetical protein
MGTVVVPFTRAGGDVLAREAAKGVEMRYARWHLKSLLVAVAGSAILLAGAAKWRRYSELRERIAAYSREERLLRSRYHRWSTGPQPWRCGNARQQAAASLAGAEEYRRLRQECEREIGRIW